MLIVECLDEVQIALTFPVMQQLRPHFEDADKYIKTVQQMRRDHGYRLVSVVDGDRCLGAMGFTTETRLFCGKMVYVADLVTDANNRSAGVGKTLIDWIKHEAKALECKMIQLDSGSNRTNAHRFYYREGFIIQAFNFRYEIEN